MRGEVFDKQETTRHIGQQVKPRGVDSDHELLVQGRWAGLVGVTFLSPLLSIFLPAPPSFLPPLSPRLLWGWWGPKNKF